MPKGHTLNIEYDNNNGQVYFPGQPVSGAIVMVLNEPTKLKRLVLSISGKAHIHWVQQKNTSHRDVDGTSHSNSYTKNYDDTERYLKQEVVLWGNQDTSSVLPAGPYSFKFSFTLPTNCMSSFESRHCFIRYYCKATMEMPWKTDCVVKRNFTVVSLVDLNLVPNLEAANRIEKTQQLYAFMYVKKKGSIHFELQVPRWGFVCGETIPFQVKISNNSSTVLSTATVSLVRDIVVIADNRHTHCSHNVVTSVAHCNIAPNGEHLWLNDGLKIPPMAPCLNNRILKILFFLELTIDPKGLHLNESVKIPIFIGNIPLRSTISGLHENFMRSNSSLATHDSNIMNPNLPNPMLPLDVNMYPDLPPPSYEEVVGESTVGATSGNKDEASGFAPKYVYYDWK